MKKINLFLLLITLTTLLNFSFLNAQWYEVSSNLPSDWFAWQIEAIDSMTAIGPFDANYIYLTTNGGISWSPISRPSLVDDIEIISTQQIWFCNGAGEIYGTSDGGTNWQLQFYDTSLTEFMNYIEMFDSIKGVAMGDAKDNSSPAIFLRTTNGGNNWISMNQSNLIGLLSGDQWRRVDFVNINTGYFYSSGESPQKLYKTTNGGGEWAVINDTLDCKVLKFFDENIGMIISFKFVSNEYIPVIYKTTDGGVSWEYVTFTTEHWTWGTDIEFAPTNPAKIWITTNPTVFTSIDYGYNWLEQVFVNDMQFLDLIFSNEDNGWLLGRSNLINCNIYRTNNGGQGGIVSVENNSENHFANDFILEQNYPNPFNPSTKVKYTIPELSIVLIKVYGVLGNEITTLVNEEKPAGNYEVEFNAIGLPSGIYFYQLKVGEFFQTKKMVYLK
jgi:photosystem II stability/assembly factor-like uncharacterized protein